MQRFEPPEPVKLVWGILFHESAPLDSCVRDLTRRFGEIDFRSGTLPFEYTDYYFEEMGRPLFRTFISYRDLVDSAMLADIKIFGSELENAYSSADGKRKINLDPGYISGSSYV